MNKKLIACAVAAALTAPAATLADGPKVYGQFHVSYGSVDEGANKTVKLRNHDSRVGVKGSRDFGNGLQGIYKFEFGVNFDGDDADATKDFFSRRNMFVGLKGGFGEVRFGRHDTPLKMAQGKFDQFGDTDADLKHAGSQDGENRIDNVVAYLNKFGPINVAVALVPGEGNGTTGGDGVADTISASASFKSGGLYLAVAHDQYDDTGAAAGTENSLTRVVGTYKMSGMQFGLLWQSGVEKVTAAANEEDWLGLSFSAKLGKKNKVKAQYIMTEDSAATRTEKTLVALGLDHKFDKKTTGYVMWSDIETETGGSTSDTGFVGVGLKLKF